MDRYLEIPTQATQPHESPEYPPLVIEYADLVDAIQLSVARQQGVPSALEAHSFEKALVSLSEEEKQRTICEVGLHFDEALIQFVMASVIATRKRPLIIVAETTDGIDGFLPWQEPLEQRIADAERNKTLTNVDVRIERVTRIEETAQEFGKYACGQTLELAVS